MTHRRRPLVDDELMQRISSAIDAEDGVDGDAELRALLDRDPDALLYAQDLVRIDEVLRDLGGRVREPDWDALAARIEAGLDGDESAEPLEAIDAPPRFLDADVRDGSVSQEVVVAPAAAAVPRAKADAKTDAKTDAKPDAKVVDLASRRRTTVFAWTGGLAAAAAVGLGIAFGSASFDASPSAESAAYAPGAYEEEASLEPSAQAVAPVMPADMPSPPAEAAGLWDGVAVAEPAAERALPGAAVAQPSIAGGRGSGGALSPSPSPAPPARLEAAPVARAPRPTTGTTAARPERADVLTSLRDVEPTVQRCIARVGEVARVTLQVGVAGNVVSARVDPPYTGATSACIVDALRAAQLPPSAEGYTFVHAFRPAPVAGGSLARPPNASRARRAAPTDPAQRAESAAGAETIDAFE